MHSQQPNIEKLKDILENRNELKNFITYILVFHKKIQLPINITKCKSFDDIMNIVNISDGIEKTIVVDINCNELNLKETPESNLIIAVTLSIKLMEDYNFCVTRIDIMATGDGKSHANKPISEITTFYNDIHYINKIL